MTDIRGMLSKDKELGELKRDLQQKLKSIPRFEIKTINGAYSEPMYLGLKEKPVGLIMLGCMDGRDQEDPESVLGGGFCHCTWEAAKSRLRINSIDGLRPDPTVLFRFNFLVVG